MSTDKTTIAEGSFISGDDELMDGAAVVTDVTSSRDISPSTLTTAILHHYCRLCVARATFFKW